MSTKIAISVDENDKVAGHAGKCQRFLVYDVSEDNQFTKSALELEETQSLHNALNEAPSNSPVLGVNMILTQGMGQSAINKLAENHKIAAYIIKEEDPDEAIDKLIKGQLQAYGQADHGCGHGHDHDHGHGGCNCSGGCH